MAGIYVHIPFCRQACHYCNFHFSTSQRYKNELATALLEEAVLQKKYLAGEPIETIYFGGGTPSLLEPELIKKIIHQINSCYIVSPGAEITLEANPDDITDEKLSEWKETGVNRLSIGIQSFFDEDLEWMNRAHNAKQAIECLQSAIACFNNITVDLIYGAPLLTNEKWKQNVEKCIGLSVPHLSCYALTVEEKTPLYKMIRQHKREKINPGQQAEQFYLLMEWLGKAGYEHYEISNFARPGFRSRHNSSYWRGEKYLGLGPSAHSFNGCSRQWNISNNNVYTDTISRGIIPFEKEELTSTQKLNEYIMLSLRTMEGLDLQKIDKDASSRLQAASKKYIDSGLMEPDKNHLKLTRKGKFFADGIAADLFF